MMRKKMAFGNHRQDAGFTLVEMMIALMMSAIIMLAVYKSAKTQQDTYIAQDQVVAMQQNLRAVTLLMTREIRMAGYDPTGNANAAITTATPSQFGFTQDLTGNGDTIEANESITFGFSNANDSDADGIADAGFAPLGRDTGGGFQPIAENIHAVEFLYTLADGTQVSDATGQEDEIRTVQVTVLAQTALADPKISNMSFSPPPPSMTTWNLPLGFRGRMETITVKCRNLGLQ